MVTICLLALAGLLLVVGVDDGVYVVVPSVIAAMTGGVASAWLFLTGSPRDEASPRSGHPHRAATEDIDRLPGSARSDGVVLAA
jgi:hypothetical protein